MIQYKFLTSKVKKLENLFLDLFPTLTRRSSAGPFQPFAGQSPVPCCSKIQNSEPSAVSLRGSQDHQSTPSPLPTAPESVIRRPLTQSGGRWMADLGASKPHHASVLKK